MNNTNECPHLKITETITGHYMATLEDPEEWVGYGTCNECGEKFDLDEYPEDAIVTKEFDMGDEDPYDADVPDIEREL